MIERPPLIEIARRHALLVALPAVLLAGALLGFGLTREPTHHAEADLIIGKVDPRIGGVSGYLSTTQALAKGYTRVVEADGVIRAASRRTGLSRQEILDRTTATLVESAPVLKLRAEGDSAAGAKTLVTVLAEAVSREINRINRPSPDPQVVLSRYREASRRSERLRAEGRDLQAQLNKLAVPSPALRDRLNAVRADAETARIDTEGLREKYEAGKADVAHNLVRVLARPRGAGDDRARTLEFLAYVGGVLGLALGLWLARRRADRELLGAPAGGTA